MTLEMRQLLDLLPEPLLLVQGDGLIIAANPSAAELFHCQGTDLAGKSLQDITDEPPEKLNRRMHGWQRSREMLPGSLTILVGGNPVHCHVQGGLAVPAASGAPAQLLLRLRLQETATAAFQNLNDRIDHLNSRIAEQRRGAMEMHAQKELLRAILGSINEGVVATDRHGVITFMNSVAEELTGYDEFTARGQSVSSVVLLLPESSEEPIQNPVYRALAANAPVDLPDPTVLISWKGHEHWITGRCTLLRDADGAPAGAVLTLQDVTKERLDSIALTESQERLRVALKNAPVLLYTTDRELRYTWFHREHPRMPTNLFLGKRDDEILPPDVGRQLVALKQRVLEQGTGERQEIQLDLEAGREVFDLTVEPLYNGTEVVGLIIAALDVSDRARAEEATHRREQEFRQLADSMPQLVWAAEPDGVLNYYNERWYEFTGLPRGLSGDLSWTSILHPDDLERCKESWYQSVRTGEPYQIEYRFWDRKTERYRWFLGRALPVRNEQGEIVRWFGTCTDIDDYRRVVEELREVNDDLRQFAYSASHDLQEPLRMIVVYSQLLGRQYADRLDGQGAEYLRYTMQGARRMEALVRDLLAYTEIGTLRGDDQTEAADCNDALESVLANLQLSIEESGAIIECSQLPVIRAHRMHIVELLQNLIGNALKYRSERPPHIRISAARVSNGWHFSVADNGIGIPAKYHTQIFGLFKRLHTQNHSSGTGIGLAICKKIVERYSGTIWVEAEEGVGSTFHFTLPAETGPDILNTVTR